MYTSASVRADNWVTLVSLLVEYLLYSVVLNLYKAYVAQCVIRVSIVLMSMILVLNSLMKVKLCALSKLEEERQFTSSTRARRLFFLVTQENNSKPNLAINFAKNLAVCFQSSQ